MNKIETVKRLSATEAARRWTTAEEIGAYREEMKALPEALANRIAPLLAPWEEMRPVIPILSASLEAVVKAVKDLDTQAVKLTETSRWITNKAMEMRPPWYQKIAEWLIIASLGSMLGGLGMSFWQRALPPTETKQYADSYVILWNKANAKEKKLFEEILSRPPKNP